MKTRSRLVAGMLLAAVTAGGVALPMNNASAVVGLITGNPAVTVLGLIFAISGDVMMRNASNHPYPHRRERSGANLIGLGILLLDSKDSQKIVFQPLTAKEAAKLGVSAESARIYNSEIEELNSVNEQVLGNVSLFAEAHADMTEAEATKMAGSEWKALEKSLSPETIRVAFVVSKNFASAK